MFGVTTTVTQTSEKVKEEVEEALVAAEVVEVIVITEITLQLPNNFLKENKKMTACISSLSLKVHVEPHNSKTYAMPCPFYASKRISSISTM